MRTVRSSRRSARVYAYAAMILVLAIVLPLGGSGRASAQSAPTLFVLPASVAPGAALHLTGYNFRLLTSTFEVIAGNAQASTRLGYIGRDNNGQIHATLTLPTLPAGDYTIQMLVAGGPSGSPVAAAPLTVLPAPTLSLSPASAPPGALVSFTAANLTPGSLRLDYAGTPVLGPLPVSGSSYSGTFVVPNNRPTPLGSTTVVSATNMVSGNLVGQARASFQSQVAPPPVSYHLTNVALPTTPLLAGTPFSVTGQLTPLPTTLLDQYQILALWHDSSGHVFPINDGSATIGTDGHFRIPVHMPALLKGDPASAAAGNQIGLTVLAPGNAAPLTQYNLSNPPAPKIALHVRVINSTGQPVANATVEATSPGYAPSPPPENYPHTTNFNLQSLRVGPPNQVQANLALLAPSDQQNPLMCAPGPTYGRTDERGLFTASFDYDQLILLNSTYSYSQLSGEIDKQPDKLPFVLQINAMYQGYTGSTDPNQAQIYKQRVEYWLADQRFHDPDHNDIPLSDPIKVSLLALNSGIHPAAPIEPTIEDTTYQTKLVVSLPDEHDPFTGGTMPVVGNFLSFTSLANDPAIEFDVNPIHIDFMYDNAIGGALTSVHLFLDGQDLGDFTPPGIGNCDHGYYSKIILESHRLTEGIHVVRISATDIVGGVTNRDLGLKFVSAPAWIGDSSYRNRSVKIQATGIGYTTELHGEQLPRGNSTSDASADVPHMGHEENTAGADSALDQTIYINLQTTTKYSGGVRSAVLNNSNANQPTKTSGDSPPSISFGASVSLLHTGRIPLFRDTWGLWPIASATAGADMWFDASLQYNGTITFNADQSTSSTLLVDPEASVGVDAWFDLSAIFGLAEADIHALPTIGVGLPVHYTNGVMDDSAKCFRYKLDLAWHAQIGKCPLCDEDGGTKNVFDGFAPADQPLCTPQPALLAAIRASSPPRATPAIASDGFGHTLALWRAPGGDLVSSEFNGATWPTPQPVVANKGIIGPNAAFFAPNQAVAAWAENSLTAEQFATATFTDSVKAQHLAYAVLNGSAWSPPQPLTSPTTGEGSVALAGCSSTDPTCPSGGAVTAVWVRDIAGALGERQFRLYYAIYQNGAWSTPQPVDPGSTATDDEPAITYSGGIPVVAWVRDADRSLGTLDDRHLALRYLDGASPIVVPSALPSGITSPSLAIDQYGQLRVAFTVAEDPGAFIGNQRTLYAAAQSCASPHSCTWQVQRLQDSHGRVFHAERPVLTLDDQGEATITFRGLGFGPLHDGSYQAFPEDALGMTMRTGELAQVEADFTGAVHSPHYLTNDAAVNWQPAAVFDPVTKSTITLAVKGPAPIIPRQLRAFSTTRATMQASALAENQPIVAVSVPRQPDFVVAAAAPAVRYPRPGQPLSVQMQIRNDGVAWSSDKGQPLDVVATWDGDPGVGAVAGQAQLTALDAGQALSVTLSLAPPPGTLDRPHTLVVTINPNQSVVEQSAANNRQSVQIGGLPAPSAVTPATKVGESLVFLQWTPPNDPRIAGYHIYRETTGGARMPVGSTFVAGFADVTAALDQSYRYVVTSYTAAGIESEPSTDVTVTLRSQPTSGGQRIYLPLVMH